MDAEQAEVLRGICVALLSLGAYAVYNWVLWRRDAEANAHRRVWAISLGLAAVAGGVGWLTLEFSVL